MKTLIIKIRMDIGAIEHMFDDLINQSKGMTKVQAKAYKKMYLLRVRGIYKAITGGKIKKYITFQTDKYTQIEQTGEDDFVEGMYSNWIKFLDSKEKKLKEYPEYQRAKSDRMFATVLRLVDKMKNKIKTKAFDKTVGQYLLEIGIVVTQKIK